MFLSLRLELLVDRPCRKRERLSDFFFLGGGLYTGYQLIARNKDRNMRMDEAWWTTL